MSKIKILVLNEPEGINGVTWWRMYEPMRALELLYGDQVEIIWNRGVILPVDLLRADVAIAWRPSTAAQLAAIAAVRQEDIPIIADFDDDIINIPSGSPAYNQFLGHKSEVTKILSMCAMLWTSTDRLKDVYRHHNTHVIPNAIYQEMIVNDPNPITKTVLWAGDYNHVEDVYAYKSEYQDIVKKSDRFYWCGWMPTWDHPDNVFYTPFISLNGYLKYLNQVKPNFIWKPMRRNVSFNIGKSNISKLVAIARGAVCATSFYDMPGFKHCFRQPAWNEKQIFGAWEAGRDEIIRDYNLIAWTDVRYRLICDLVNGTVTPQPKEFKPTTGVY